MSRADNRFYRTASDFDGRGSEPTYLTVTDVDEAERNERERCAVVAETLELRMAVAEWRELPIKQITKRLAIAIADAIRNQ